MTAPEPEKFLGLAGFFEPAFLSHEMGSRKPEPGIFDNVIKDLKVSAQTIIFFDDVAANIDAARAAGMIAHHIEYPQMLASALQRATR